MQTVDLSQTLQRAFQHHTACDFQQAETLYRQILDANPVQPEALHLSGLLAFQTGEKAAAVDLISKAVAIAPDNAEAQFHLGVALQALDRLDAAVESYRSAIEIEPDHIEAYNNLGAVYEDLNRLEEAVASYREAISIKPDYAGAHMNLGAVYRKLGRPEEAVAYYRKALKIEPDYAELHFNLGIAQKDLARLDEAIASYRKAISIKPDYAVAHENLGNALREQGQYAEAIESYHDALAIDPDLVDAHVDLGITLHELKRFDDALERFQKALGIEPDSSYARQNLAILLWSLERFEEALNIFKTFDTPSSYARTLECLFALGKYDEFYEKQKECSNKQDSNLRAATINAFASNQLNRENPHPFCKQPLDFIRVYDALDSVNDATQFLDRLAGALEKQTVVWEPFRKTTISGYQSPAVLFDKPAEPLAELNLIIEDKIKQYRGEEFSENRGFINSFPETYSVNAWYGKLLKGGYRTSHIHPSGWLSGVFYLRVPELGNREEGAIEFSLRGYGYPVLDENYPRKRHCPKNGDLVLFPSSLFHGTIPFHTDEERLIIAFDLVPTER